MNQRTDQAIACRRCQSVSEAAEFGKQIKDPSGCRPTQRTKAAEFSAGVVGDKQRARIGAERWGTVEFPAAPAPCLSALQFLRYHASRPRPFARSAGLFRRCVTAEIEFEIDGHDRAEW
jgi:hypothetical protein